MDKIVSKVAQQDWPVALLLLPRLLHCGQGE